MIAVKARPRVAPKEERQPLTAEEKAALVATCVARFTLGMHHADNDLLRDEARRVEAMQESPLVLRMRLIVEAEQTVRRAVTLLARLGGTGGAIADRLHELRIRGSRCWSHACPLAIYLEQHGIQAFVSAEEITVQVGTAKAFVATPQPVADFVQLVDRGFFPDVVDDALEQAIGAPLMPVPDSYQHDFVPGGPWGGCARLGGSALPCALPEDSPYHAGPDGHTVEAVLAYEAHRAERLALELAGGDSRG